MRIILVVAENTWLALRGFSLFIPQSVLPGFALAEAGEPLLDDVYAGLEHACVLRVGCCIVDLYILGDVHRPTVRRE